MSAEADDAFLITLRGCKKRASDEALAASGRERQQTHGRDRTQRLSTLLNVSRALGAFEGQCWGSTGATDKHNCADLGANSTPWLPPRPLVRSNIGSVTTCIEICQRCPRCRWVSYSLMLQLCTWTHTCDPGVNGSKLDKRYEMYTYRSFQVRKGMQPDGLAAPGADVPG